jgi:hypothetical protein
MFTPEEASLVSLLPVKPFSAEEASVIWKINEQEACNILNSLAEKALLLDMNDGKEKKYVLPPPMIGFFEFALMRTGGVFDQKLLSELFHQYIEKEEDFTRKLLSLKTPVGRILVNEKSISSEDEVYVLDYERATEIKKRQKALV